MSKLKNGTILISGRAWGKSHIGKLLEKDYHELKISQPTASVRLFCDLEADCPFTINTHTTEEAQLWMFSILFSGRHQGNRSRWLSY